MSVAASSHDSYLMGMVSLSRDLVASYLGVFRGRYQHQTLCSRSRVVAMAAPNNDVDMDNMVRSTWRSCEAWLMLDTCSRTTLKHDAWCLQAGEGTPVFRAMTPVPPPNTPAIGDVIDLTMSSSPESGTASRPPKRARVVVPFPDLDTLDE